MKRYSKNRQAIIDCLMSTKSHPTAEWVYEKLKPEYPSLSLATVYRNLAQLKEDGAIRSVGIVEGRERFDGDVTPHSHVICTKCGKTADVKDVPVPSDIAEEVHADTGFTVTGSDVKFYGLCADCAAES